jgi:hypothetical protein
MSSPSPAELMAATGECCRCARAQPRDAMRIRQIVAIAIAAVAMASCADYRPLVPPPAVSVSMLITLSKWSWIQDGDRQRHAGGGSGRAQAAAPLAGHLRADDDRSGPDRHQGGDNASAVLVETGYGDLVYDSRPLDRFVEKATIQAALGVRNWIRIRDGERTIEVGSIAGRKGAGIIIELGPGISTSEY